MVDKKTRAYKRTRWTIRWTRLLNENTSCIVTFGVENSSILNNNEQYLRSILLWLKENMTEVGDWSRCFHAAVDGFEASTFHAQCDNKPDTLTIVRSGLYIFGGYASNPWKKIIGGKYFGGTTSWLFSLKNADNLQPMKLSIVRMSQYATHTSARNGPTFGCGFDLRICNSANTRNCSLTTLGCTYKMPPGYEYQSVKINTLFAGYHKFLVSDFEVFYKN